MGIGSFFSKLKGKEEKVVINEGKVEFTSPVSGTRIALEEVNDPAFAGKMLGDGYAVRPDKNQAVVAPCDGEISSMFATDHAFSITTKEGLEVLIHIGIDTVSLEGRGFKHIKDAGDIVKKGTPIIEVDFEYINENAPSSDVIVVITNMDKVKNMELTTNTNVDVNEHILDVNC